MFSISVYPSVTLADARQRRDEAKKLLAPRIDPSAKKQSGNKTTLEKRNNIRAFKMVAKSWFATKTHLSGDYLRPVWTCLETCLFPDIDNKDIGESGKCDLLVPIKKIEILYYLEIATRVNQYVTAILRYSIQQKIICFNPAYNLESAVKKPQIEHRPAIELEDIPDLLKRIDGYQGRSRLTVLTITLNLLKFVRPSELRFARWLAINFKSALWVIAEQREVIEMIKHSGRGAKTRRKI